jgi:hypothetical protein
VEGGAGGRFRKQGKGGEGGRIRQRDCINRPDLAADFVVIDYVIKLAITRQQVQERVN